MCILVKIMKLPVQEELQFYDLTWDVMLKIFDFLEPKDLLSCCIACKHLHEICSSEQIWRPKLATAVRKMSAIWHDRNPLFYCRVSDLSSKDVYVKCLVPPRKPRKDAYSTQIQRLLRMLSPAPRIVMFGPGLETKTSRLVRSILTDDKLGDTSNTAPRFHVTGLVPGEFSGIGSGIALRINSCAFNLVTLYSNTKSIRINAPENERMLQNRLFTRGFELTPPVRELCRQSSAFIFVVDAQETPQGSGFQAELHAVLGASDCVTGGGAPLLLLSCSRNSARSTSASSAAAGHTKSCAEIVDLLGLDRVSRKWLAQSADVESLTGVREGVCWLLAQL